MNIFNLQPNQSLSACRKNTFAFITISILVFIIYSNNYSASWHFDDEPNILNRDELHLKNLNWKNIYKTFFWGKKIFRPVSCFSLALNYYFDKEKVFGYHLVNNFIHILSSIFLFLFIHQALKLPGLRGDFEKDAYDMALLATIFWASNPIHTQSVTYIVQRMTSMAGMFYIMSIYFYTKARLNSKKSYRTFLFILSTVTAFLAFGSKENTIILPVTVLLLEIILIQQLSFKVWLKENKTLSILLLSGFLVMALIYFQFVRGGGFTSFLDHYESRPYGLKERLLTEPRVIIYYITQLLYPMPSRLCVNHDFSLSYSLFHPITTLFAIMLIAFLIVGAFILSKRIPLISFSIIFFLLNHSIESTVLPLELVFEHRNYIPSMLIFIPISFIIIKILKIFHHRKIMAYLILSCITLVLIAYGHSTFIRNHIWKTEESLWLDCIEKYPDLWRPHNNLARYYSNNNRIEEAISEYRIALTKKSRNYRDEEVLSAYNLGLLYQIRKNEEKALQYYQMVEKVHPFFALTYVGKGILFMEKGLMDEARFEFNKAIRIDKSLASSYANLGLLQLITGETDHAITNLELAVRKGFIDAKTYRHLGRAYRLKGQNGMALLMFKKSMELDSHDPITLLDLIELYSISHMTSMSEEMANRFFSLFQGNGLKLKNFIEELFKKGQITTATLPDMRYPLAILGEKSRDKSQIYGSLSDYCFQKKSELAETPVHSD